MIPSIYVLSYFKEQNHFPFSKNYKEFNISVSHSFLHSSFGILVHYLFLFWKYLYSNRCSWYLPLSQILNFLFYFQHCIGWVHPPFLFVRSKRIFLPSLHNCIILLSAFSNKSVFKQIIRSKTFHIVFILSYGFFPKLSEGIYKLEVLVGSS